MCIRFFVYPRYIVDSLTLNSRLNNAYLKELVFIRHITDFLHRKTRQHFSATPGGILNSEISNQKAQNMEQTKQKKWH